MIEALNKLKSTALNFNYTGSNFTEKEIIAKGYSQLSGKELLLKISDKIIAGDYPNGFTFAANIYSNGFTNGINNVGSVDNGNWKIDFENDTLQLVWENGWFNTLTRAYLVEGNIEFYDTDTGNWRTTFKIINDLKEE